MNLTSHCYFNGESKYCQRTTSNESIYDQDEKQFLYTFSVTTDNEDMLECLLNYPEMDYHTVHPLDYQEMADAQQQDADLMQNVAHNPTKYSRESIEDVELIVYTATPTARWKICIPEDHLGDTIRWYHQALNHTGISRLYHTITMHFYHSRLRTRIEDIVKACDACQRMKLPGKGYGELPPKEPRMVPW